MENFLGVAKFAAELVLELRPGSYCGVHYIISLPRQHIVETKWMHLYFIQAGAKVWSQLFFYTH